MTASQAALSNKSDTQLQALISTSEAELLAIQARIKTTSAAAAKILKERDEKARRDKDLQAFTNALLDAILKSNKKSRLDVPISSDITPKFLRTTPRYSQVVDALGKKFKVTIKVEHDNGNDYDAGSYGSGGFSSSKAIVTFNNEPSKPKPKDPVLKALLKQIAQA